MSRRPAKSVRLRVWRVAEGRPHRSEGELRKHCTGGVSRRDRAKQLRLTGEDFGRKHDPKLAKAGGVGDHHPARASVRLSELSRRDSAWFGAKRRVDLSLSATYQCLDVEVRITVRAAVIRHPKGNRRSSRERRLRQINIEPISLMQGAILLGAHGENCPGEPRGPWHRQWRRGPRRAGFRERYSDSEHAGAQYRHASLKRSGKTGKRHTRAQSPEHYHRAVIELPFRGYDEIVVTRGGCVSCDETQSGIGIQRHPASTTAERERDRAAGRPCRRHHCRRERQTVLRYRKISAEETRWRLGERSACYWCGALC